jgi:MinD superfamily P-loop ATPase
MLYAVIARGVFHRPAEDGGRNLRQTVTEVKRRLNRAAGADTPLAVLDGSPGIGCPVIASLSGVSMALIVAEPSVPA